MPPARKLLSLLFLILMGTELTQVGASNAIFLPARRRSGRGTPRSRGACARAPPPGGWGGGRREGGGGWNPSPGQAGGTPRSRALPLSLMRSSKGCLGQLLSCGMAFWGSGFLLLLPYTPLLWPSPLFGASGTPRPGGQMAWGASWEGGWGLWPLLCPAGGAWQPGTPRGLASCEHCLSTEHVRGGPCGRCSPF